MGQLDRASCSSWTGTAERRCTNRSSARSVRTSGRDGWRRGRGSPPPAASPPSWESRAGSSARPTVSSPPRATCSPARARRRGFRPRCESLSEYLGRVHGAAADPEQIIVCTGFSQGLSLIVHWLQNRGVERIALEDPGWHNHRLVVEQAGLEVAPVPVDDEGLCVEALEATDAAAVVVTPAHQFPTGTVLSSERRAALIEWAEREEKLIVEDDFDSELRYEGSGVGALQGLAPERVAYIGSASKRLVPAMRLGWMLTPSWLGWPLISVKAVEDRGSEAIGQLALHDFIARGELDRHLRRMRQRYGLRREALLEAISRHLPEARLCEGAAGLYELAEFPPEVDEAALIGAAAMRGLGLEGLALHRFRPGGPAGLVLGFANLPEPAIEQSVRLIAEALAKSWG